MTIQSGKHYAVGLRYATAFKLGSNGLPDWACVNAETAHEGYEFFGPQAWEVTIPEMRKIVHAGNDRVVATDFLPTLESGAGILTVAAQDQVVNAMLTHVNSFDVPTLGGDIYMIPWLTEQQGSEPNIGLFLFQQSLDKDTKLRTYRFHCIPKARVSPATGGMSESPSVTRYSAIFNPSTKHLWGTAMTLAEEGCTEAALIEGMSEYRPKLVAWKADGSETAFLFPTDKPAVSTAKIAGVWVNGVYAMGAGLALTVTTLTFTPAPAINAIIVALYEY